MTDNNTYVGYVEEPQGRGTWSLVLSCLLTLVLCVWSALHLNVPAQGQSCLSTLALNFRWIITGIYAPELVVFTAWRQWSSARLLNQIVQKHSNPHGIRGTKTSWSMAHSFFACTGGFAIESGAAGLGTFEKNIEANTGTRLAITARGVALLARYGCLPQVTKAEIMDKSKANNLAKGAVIIQAGWMLLQVVGRLCVQLPVTLLEVNTIAHVLCAFAMYLFWWDKPLLPEEPIVLQEGDFPSLTAFMYTSSEASGSVNNSNLQSQTVVKTLFAHMNLYSKTPEIETLALRAAPKTAAEQSTSSQQITELGRDTASSSKGQGVQNSIQSVESSFRIHQAPAECLDELKKRREKDAGTAFFERRPRIVQETGSKTSQQDRDRWQQLEAALDQYPDLLHERVSLVHEVDAIRCVHLKPEQFVADHIQNWPGDDLLRSVNGLVVGMILWLANFCYGGIHAAAWNDHFPSNAEKWMWQGSACYIGFCGGLWVVLNFIVANYPPLNEFWERWMDGEKKWWQSLGLGILVFVCGFSLVLARIFIVVEAFVSIRELPKTAYVTPEWTDIFPHF